MSGIKTIDERIRVEAKAELTRRINNAAESFKKAIEIIGCTDQIKITTSNPQKEVTAYNRSLIDEIKKAAIEKLSTKYEEIAVTKFLQKLESISSDVDSLYNEIGR